MPLRTPARSRLRSVSLRTSLLLLALVPSLTLVGLWLETPSRLLSQGYNLRAENAINQKLSRPFGEMIEAVAQERTLSAVWLADRNASHAALDAQRRKTDVAITKMEKVSTTLEDIPQRARETFQPVSDALQDMDRANLRDRIDRRSIDAKPALAAFTHVIDAGLVGTTKIFQQVPDASLVVLSIPTGTLIETREQMGLEDAILASAVASGRLTPEARQALVQAVGARRWLVARAPEQLGDPFRTQVEELTRSREWKTMEEIEDAVIAGSQDGSTDLPAVARKWPSTYAKVNPQMWKATMDPIIAYNGRAHARAETLVQQGLLISGAQLAAILTVSLLSWWVARSLMRRLTGLRKATLELAEVRLPDVVERLNRGERVEVEPEAASLDYGNDELGQVAQAFNTAQATALRSTVALADARLGFQQAILGIARHSQNLVNRQLSLLDSMERKHQEPDVLEGLYELDSQASQIRRYEENLVIISGGRPGRRWSQPVAVVDVVRSAVGEIAEYQRVTVHVDERLKLAAHAVADVIHLLAELMDNAAAFSPSSCPVWVRSEFVGRGLALEIEDRGLGMTEEEYTEANQKLSGPPRFDVLALGDDLRLGLFVVARLASQHGIRVTLRSSPFGGSSAVILIPAELMLEDSQAGRPGAQAGSGANTGHRAAPAGTEEPPAYAEEPPAYAKEPPVYVEEAPVYADEPSAYADEWPEPARRDVFPTAGRTVIPLPTALPAHEPAAGMPGTAAPLGSGVPPLPQRVPQTSLSGESHHAPSPAAAFPDAPAPLPRAEQVARTMSAFQRGSVHARDFGTPSDRDPHSAAPTKDPR